MFSLLKIGDISQLNRISIQTLRHYEKVGLIKPDYVNEETNYRYYKIEQSAKIDMIQFLKLFDFSLADIKKLLQEADNLPLIQQKLDEKEIEMLHLKAELETKINLLEHFKEANSIYQENLNKTEMELIEFPKRYIYTYPIEKNIYEMKKDEYEFSLRTFKQHLTDKGFPVAYFNRVGSLIQRENFISSQFTSKELFIFTQNHKGPNKHRKFLPQGTYAVTYCQSFEDEIKIIQGFRKKITENQLTIVGDYVCEVLYEVPSYDKNERQMFIRLQVPVLKNTLV